MLIYLSKEANCSKSVQIDGRYKNSLIFSIQIISNSYGLQQNY
jgi:hypothetical protein